MEELVCQFRLEHPAWGGRKLHTHLSAWLIRRGITVLHGRPFHPQTRPQGEAQRQGKEKRFHGSLVREVLAAVEVWRQVYNHRRPHEALAYEEPACRYVPSPRRFLTEPGPIVYEVGDQVGKGAGQGADQLPGTRSRAPMTSEPATATPLVLRTVVNASRERVYRAWTDPADLARWYTPGDDTWSARVVAIDARPGGRLVVEFGAPRGEQYVETAEYLDLDPPARLVFTTTLHTGGQLIEETHCTVELRDLGDRTEVIVTETGFTPEMREERREGWGQTLGHLVALFA
jgi:uncharacterized protein YndB with AHSA1/START domain